MSTAVGYVYILTNKHIPDLVKVGYTDRNPFMRASELSNVTGVPGKWEVYHSWKLVNAYNAEQQIFTSLKKYKEAGEFLKLQPDVAVENITVVLAANGHIDSSGLSSVMREETERLKREMQLRRERAEIRQIFTRIDNELHDATERVSDDFFEKKRPQMRMNRFINALIWGSGAYIVALTFTPTNEGALIMSGIFAFFAFVFGDGRYRIAESDELKKATTQAINNVWLKNGFEILISDPPIGWQFSRGLVFDDANQYEYVGSGTIRNKQSGEKYRHGHEYISVGRFIVILSTKRIISQVG